VIVQGHGKMVPDEIFGRDSHVHGVPEVELIPEAVQLLLAYVRVLGLVESGSEEDVVPSVNIQMFRADAKRADFLSVEVVLSLELRGYSVVSHVNGRVRERLDNELLIPRDSGTQTESSRATPLLEPVQDKLEFVLGLGIVSFKFIRLDVGHDLVLPLFFAILHKPLVDQRDNTVILSPRNDLVLRLVINNGLAILHHQVLRGQLGILDLLASTDSAHHDSLVEALLVAHFLSFGKLVLVLV